MVKMSKTSSKLSYQFQFFFFLLLSKFFFTLSENTKQNLLYISKIPTKSSFFVILDKGIFIYDTNLINNTTILEFSKKQRSPKENTDIFFTQEKEYYTWFMNDLLYIYNPRDKKVYYHILNTEPDSEPFNMEINDTNLIIYLIKRNKGTTSIMKRCYFIKDLPDKIIFQKDKEIFVINETLSKNDINCLLNKKNNLFQCLYFNNGGIIEVNINEDSNEIKKNFLGNLLNNKKINKIKSTFDNNNNYLFCALFEDYSSKCFIKINNDKFNEIKCSIKNECQNIEVYYFEENDEFVLACLKKKEIVLSVVKNINKNNEISCSEKTVFISINEKDSFSVIYNNKDKDYQIISGQDFIKPNNIRKLEMSDTIGNDINSNSNNNLDNAFTDSQSDIKDTHYTNPEKSTNSISGVNKDIFDNEFKSSSELITDSNQITKNNNNNKEGNSEFISDSISNPNIKEENPNSSQSIDNKPEDKYPSSEVFSEDNINGNNKLGPNEDEIKSNDNTFHSSLITNPNMKTDKQFDSNENINENDIPQTIIKSTSTSGQQKSTEITFDSSIISEDSPNKEKGINLIDSSEIKTDLSKNSSTKKSTDISSVFTSEINEDETIKSSSQKIIDSTPIEDMKQKPNFKSSDIFSNPSTNENSVITDLKKNNDISTTDYPEKIPNYSSTNNNNFREDSSYLDTTEANFDDKYSFTNKEDLTIKSSDIFEGSKSIPNTNKKETNFITNSNSINNEDKEQIVSDSNIKTTIFSQDDNNSEHSTYINSENKDKEFYDTNKDLTNTNTGLDEKASEGRTSSYLDSTENNFDDKLPSTNAKGSKIKSTDIFEEPESILNSKENGNDFITDSSSNKNKDLIILDSSNQTPELRNKESTFVSNSNINFKDNKNIKGKSSDISTTEANFEEHLPSTKSVIDTDIKSSDIFDNIENSIKNKETITNSFESQTNNESNENKKDINNIEETTNFNKMNTDNIFDSSSNIDKKSKYNSEIIPSSFNNPNNIPTTNTEEKELFKSSIPDIIFDSSQINSKLSPNIKESTDFTIPSSSNIIKESTEKMNDDEFIKSSRF